MGEEGGGGGGPGRWGTGNDPPDDAAPRDVAPVAAAALTPPAAPPPPPAAAAPWPAPWRAPAASMGAATSSRLLQLQCYGDQDLKKPFRRGLISTPGKGGVSRPVGPKDAALANPKRYLKVARVWIPRCGARRGLTRCTSPLLCCLRAAVLGSVLPQATHGTPQLVSRVGHDAPPPSANWAVADDAACSISSKASLSHAWPRGESLYYKNEKWQPLHRRETVHRSLRW